MQQAATNDALRKDAEKTALKVLFKAFCGYPPLEDNCPVDSYQRRFQTLCRPRRAALIPLFRSFSFGDGKKNEAESSPAAFPE